MATATATVRSGGNAVPGVLVELFSVPSGFQTRLPVADRSSLAALENVQRLGSDLTDSAGRVVFEYGPDPAPSYDLWLLVSSYAEDGALVIAYQEPAVRAAAAPSEQFVATLRPESVPRGRMAAGPASVLATRKGLLDVSAAVREAMREPIKQRAVTQAAFRTRIAPHLIAEISTVERNKAGAAVDPDYVGPEASARATAETRIAATVRARFAAGASDSLVLRGRVSLTEEQVHTTAENFPVDPVASTAELMLSDMDHIQTGGALAGSPDRLRAASQSRVEVHVDGQPDRVRMLGPVVRGRFGGANREDGKGTKARVVNRCRDFQRRN